MIRIGEVAERTGVTPRTIRYYEEIGLLAGSARRKGEHRLYDDADIERLHDLTRLRDLLNLSLEELKQVLEAEDACAALRRCRAAASSAEHDAGALLALADFAATSLMAAKPPAVRSVLR